MIYKGKANEYLQFENLHSSNCYTQKEPIESPLTFLWFEKDGSTINIDNIYQLSNILNS